MGNTRLYGRSYCVRGQIQALISEYLKYQTGDKKVDDSVGTLTISVGTLTIHENNIFEMTKNF
jgi:hypothetical protein